MSRPNVNVVNLKGENGSIYITDTLTHIGPFDVIEGITTATANLTGGNMGGTVTAVPVAAGQNIYGNFPTIALGGGSVIAYYKKPQQVQAAPPVHPPGPAPVQSVAASLPNPSQSPG